MILASLFGKAIVGIRTNEFGGSAPSAGRFHYKLRASSSPRDRRARRLSLRRAVRLRDPQFLGCHIVQGDMLYDGDPRRDRDAVRAELVGALAMEVLQEIFKDLTNHWLLSDGRAASSSQPCYSCRTGSAG